MVQNASHDPGEQDKTTKNKAGKDHQEQKAPNLSSSRGWSRRTLRAWSTSPPTCSSGSRTRWRREQPATPAASTQKRQPIRRRPQQHNMSSIEAEQRQRAPVAKGELGGGFPSKTRVFNMNQVGASWKGMLCHKRISMSAHCLADRKESPFKNASNNPLVILWRRHRDCERIPCVEKGEGKAGWQGYTHPRKGWTLTTQGG